MHPLPVPPLLQGLQCATFTSPPLDGSLSLLELCDWHGQISPDHTLFVYAEDDGRIRNVRWSEGSRAIRCAAQLVRQRIGRKEGGGDIPVVAILSSSGRLHRSPPLTGVWIPQILRFSDAIPFVTTILGVIRANCVAFPISPRNSPAAVAHLLDKVGARHILVGREQAMQDLVAQSLEVSKSQYGTVVEAGLSSMLTFADLYSSGEAIGPEDVPYERQESDVPALIMHSSGQ